MISYYEYDEDGELIPVSHSQAKKGGRFRMQDGKLVRFADSRAIPDRTFSTKGAFDNPVFNHADGKYYTNLHSYENAVKASGGRIVGNEAIKLPPKIDSIDWKSAVKETIDQLSPTQKGKKNARKR